MDPGKKEAADQGRQGLTEVTMSLTTPGRFVNNWKRDRRHVGNVLRRITARLPKMTIKEVETLARAFS